MDSNQILQMRQANMSDSDIMDSILGQDQGFKAGVDRVKMANPNMSSLERANLPKVMLNKYYNVPDEGIKTPKATAQFQTTVEGAQDVRNVVSQTWKGSAGKAAKNFLPSLGTFGKDVFMAIKNVGDIGDFTDNGFDFNLDENTVANLGKLGLGAAINATEGLQNGANHVIYPLLNKVFGTDHVPPDTEGNFDFLGEFGQNAEEMADVIGGFYKERLGSLEAARSTFETDPVGFAADIAMLFTGGASGLSKAGKISTVLGRTRKAGALNKASLIMRKTASVIDPIENAARLFRKTVQLNKGLISKMSGLEVKTLNQLVNNAENIKGVKSGKIGRSSVLKELEDVFKSLTDELDETGAAYQAFRESGQVAKMEPDFFRTFLKKQGYSLDDTGLVVSSFDNPIQLLDPEIASLNKFLKDADAMLKDVGEITSNQFMGIRTRMGKLANFDRGTNASDLNKLMQRMRGELNNNLRGSLDDINDTGKFNGLKELDAEFIPQIEELNKLKADWINKSTGELKTSAEAGINNITSKNKGKLLERIEKHMPGVEGRVNAIRAIEDVATAKGPKVGSYLSPALGAGGIATGNIPMIVAAILTQPDIIVPMLRKYGQVKGLSSKAIGSMTNNIAKGTKLTPQQSRIFSDMLRDYEVMLREATVAPERALNAE